MSITSNLDGFDSFHKLMAVIEEEKKDLLSTLKTEKEPAAIYQAQGGINILERLIDKINEDEQEEKRDDTEIED
jgi:hypothetical protein